MSDTPDTSVARNHWQRAITRVMRRVNAAVWLERFAPGVFVCGTLGALVFYAMRRLQIPATGWAWLALAIALGIAAFVAWRRARGAFFSRGDARAFLEYQLRIHSRLSAADAGVAPWPRAADAPQNVLRWKPRAPLGWLAGALVMFAAGLWLPAPALNLAIAHVEKPPSLAQTEEWLKDLAQTNAVDPQSLENIEAQARELAAKPTENQYTHSSLEAADSLREQTSQAMQTLAREFDSAGATLATLALARQTPDESGEPLSDEQLKRAAAQLDKALHGLNEGALAANKELAAALQKLDAGALRELTAEQAAKLAKQLCEAGKAVRCVMNKEGAAGDNAGGTCDNAGDGDALAALFAALEGAKGGSTMRLHGNGGVSRGRGDAPLNFENRESNTGDGGLQTVQNGDYSRAALGDKLGVQIGEHTIDRSAGNVPVSAGALAAPARGGDTVWVNKLTPSERETLREFYK